MSDLLTQAEAKRIAEETVHEVLLRLGIDEEEENAFSEFRADILYARKMRRASDTVGQAGLWAIVGILVTGAIGAFWVGITSVIPH